MTDPQATDRQAICEYCRTSPHLHPEVHDMLLGAAAEIERLERESASWSGLAATRNRNIVLIAEERDAERTKRQQAEHERDCAVEKVAGLLTLLKRARYGFVQHLCHDGKIGAGQTCLACEIHKVIHPDVSGDGK